VGPVAKAEDRAPVRDEVNEPLSPVSERRPAATAGWTTLAFAAPAAVAVVMAVFTFGGRDARLPGGSPAKDAQALPAQVRAEPQPSAQPATVAAPVVPPIATADQVEAASGVKVTRNGAVRTPTPLIIDVQQALAAERAKTPTIVPR
jgi:hypothetical protein